MKNKIVWDWRLIWRTWSFRFDVIAACLIGVLTAMPDWFVEVWNLLPMEFRNAIPEQHRPLVGLFFILLAMLSRFIRQNKLEVKRADAAIESLKKDYKGPDQ